MKVIFNNKINLALIILILLHRYFPLSSQTESRVMNRTMSDKFMVESTTLISAGFEWTIHGDKNRNSRVSVSFRRLGDNNWMEGLPLLRIGGEKIYGHGQRWVYTTPDMFAGSIFNLVSNTAYECRFKLEDPDGVEGMEKVKAEKPDLVLLDIMMPGKGGISMYRDLRRDEETKDIPVIIITGVARGQRFEESMMRKDPHIPLPDGYIEKPMKPEGLLELVGKLLK